MRQRERGIMLKRIKEFFRPNKRECRTCTYRRLGARHDVCMKFGSRSYCFEERGVFGRCKGICWEAK